MGKARDSITAPGSPTTSATAAGPSASTPAAAISPGTTSVLVRSRLPSDMPSAGPLGRGGIVAGGSAESSSSAGCSTEPTITLGDRIPPLPARTGAGVAGRVRSGAPGTLVTGLADVSLVRAPLEKDVRADNRP